MNLITVHNCTLFLYFYSEVSFLQHFKIIIILNISQKSCFCIVVWEKFRDHEYKSITEFVADFRTMLENSFRFHGPDHIISKRGQRLETKLEQKLALLPR